MGRHQAKNARRVARRVCVVDPKSTQTITHSCGHVKSYDGLPKFNPLLLGMVINVKTGMACPDCNKKKRVERKAAKKPVVETPGT